MEMYTHSDFSDRLVALRRDLHSHPELRFDEHRTSGIVANWLIDLGWSVQTHVGGTGILAQWASDYDGTRILLRADMDAYPILDSKVLDYSSQNPGVCHACGHDVHMTVLLGLAEQLSTQIELRQRVTLMFQPAEEIPFGQGSGARAMLESGQLEKTYTAVLGLHCWPQLQVGMIGVDVGAAMAAKDAFSVMFSGVSAHVATPANGRDAILAASQTVLALHASLNRERNPNDLVAFNVGTFHAGTSQSALAASAELTGTLRTHDPIVRSRLKQTIERVCAGVADAVGLSSVITWANEMPSLMNDAQLVKIALENLSADGIRAVQIDSPPLTSDDFALLGERGPMLYMKLGTSPDANGSSSPLHSSSFDVDEACIEVGIKALETMLFQIVNRHH